jgi:hypothetical protein
MAAGPRDTWERRSAEALKHTASNTNTIDIDMVAPRARVSKIATKLVAVK